MRLDTTLSTYACDHFGVLSWSEALTLGATPKQLDYRVACGTLVPVFPGVYRHAAAPETWEGSVRGALLAAGDNAYASGASAMRLYGIRGVWDASPEVTVHGWLSYELPGVRLRRIDRLETVDVTRRFGLPVLAPPLTLLLLGAVASERKVETAVHDIVHLRLTTRARLVDTLARYGGRGRRGTRKFRLAVRALPRDGSVTERNLELDLLRLLRSHGVPEPVAQFSVVDATGRRRRLDFAYPALRLALETDGERWHSSPIDRAADAQRDLHMGLVGWRVLRFSPDDIHVWPDRTIAAIRRSLAAQPQLLGSSGQRTQVG